ncbi:MAG: DUF1330 domain-containing protein [Betaproteobacteria bacterium]|jgi:uncharacterized protein (DUF1330 family)|nr:DUF1330 domain-containing protein [Betaproteobacteria bacterium]
MAAYCFFDILEFTDQAKMNMYREGVLETVQKYQGRYLVLGGKCDVIEGNWRPTVPVIIEFPSLEQAHRWYNSPEYKPLLKLRLEGSRGNAVFIEGR